MLNDVFEPMTCDGLTLSVTSTSSNGQLSAVPASSGALQARVYNSGPNTAFVQFGADNTVTATANKMPIPAGNTEVFSVGNALWVAAICASTQTATLYVTPGRGA